MFSKTFFVLAAFAVGALAAPTGRYVSLPGLPLSTVNGYYLNSPLNSPSNSPSKDSSNTPSKVPTNNPSKGPVKSTPKKEYCCKSLENSNTPAGAPIAKSIGIPTDKSVPLGVTCKPIAAVGAAKW